MKQVEPAVEVGPVVVVVDITSSATSSVLAKRKRDDGVGLSGRKKSKASMSLRVLRQATRLMPGAVCDILEFLPGIL